MYLDHSATSPLLPEALDAMVPYLTSAYGNPSSRHLLGRQAAEALDSARRDIAAVLGCRASCLTFTSGGTESNNLALKSAEGSGTIVTSAVEHRSVLDPAAGLSAHGGAHRVVPVDSQGVVDLEQLERALRDNPILCSVMYANNEVGSVQPVANVAALCRANNVLFHCDAVQAPGLLPIDIETLGADLVTLSAHKFGGPKGVGLLYCAPRVALRPQVEGGGQERGLRSGTENVAAIVGMATALTLVEAARPDTVRRIGALRDQLIDAVCSSVPQAVLTGAREQRLAHHASFCFEGISGDAVLQNLEMAGVYCSSGSACSASDEEASHVLLAMGVSADTAQTSVRFTMGPSTTASDIERLTELVPQAVDAVQTLA